MEYMNGKDTWRYTIGPLADRVRAAMRHAVCRHCRRDLGLEKSVARDGFYFHVGCADVGLLSERIAVRSPASFQRLADAKRRIAQARIRG